MWAGNVGILPELPVRSKEPAAVISFGRGVMNEEQRAELLRIARTSIERELGKNKSPVKSGLTIAPEIGGAFVTLRRGKRLAGCMGTFHPKDTLTATIESVARLACRDPRFSSRPVTVDDLPGMSVEISVLGPLERTDEPASLVPGTHGILIRRGEASGCFLPQVATECGWTAVEFLNRCSSTKVGVAEDAWRKSDTSVYLFTAEVFGN